VDINEVSPWFAKYLDVFQACGRGELDALQLLTYYGVPLIVTTDDRSLALTSKEHVLAMAQQQVDGMRAVSYDHSDVLTFEVIPLNATSDLYRGEFSRRRDDGSEIGRLGATYLASDGGEGRRMSAIALHSS
jgi:hypothetical protein